MSKWSNSRELWLMRHAKSDWSEAGLDDFQRPLNKRGHKDAGRMGRWVAGQYGQPDLLLSSAAQRARQTSELFAEGADLSNRAIVYRDELYLASAQEMLTQLQSLSGDLQRVMLVAHNPGMDELLRLLAAEEPTPNESGKLMTTASFARLLVPCCWDTLQPHSGELDRLVRPKELSKET